MRKLLKIIAAGLTAAACSTAAHAGLRVGQEVQFRTPAPACRNQSVAQQVETSILRFAAANNFNSMEVLGHSPLWNQVKAFVYNHTDCALLDAEVPYKIVEVPILNGEVFYCLITTRPFDVRSPEEVAKETPEEKAAAEKKYCYWTGLPDNGRW